MAADVALSGSTLSPMLRGKYRHTKEQHIKLLRQWACHRDQIFINKVQHRMRLANVTSEYMAQAVGVSLDIMLNWLDFTMPIMERSGVDVLIVKWLKSFHCREKKYRKKRCQKPKNVPSSSPKSIIQVQIDSSETTFSSSLQSQFLSQKLSQQTILYGPMEQSFSPSTGSLSSPENTKRKRDSQSDDDNDDNDDDNDDNDDNDDLELGDFPPIPGNSFPEIYSHSSLLSPHHIHGPPSDRESPSSISLTTSTASAVSNGQPENGQPENGQPENGQPDFSSLRSSSDGWPSPTSSMILPSPNPDFVISNSGLPLLSSPSPSNS